MYKKLEKKLNLTFKDNALIKNAFIHRSYLNEHKESKGDYYLQRHRKDTRVVYFFAKHGNVLYSSKY